MSDEYQSPDILVAASDLATEAQVALSEATGWIPEDDSPLAALANAISLGMAAVMSRVQDATDADIAAVATAFGRPPKLASSAQVTGTVVASDTAGHVISEGDVYLFTASADGGQALVEVVNDATISAGSASTATGGVLFVFQNAGAAYNDLSGTLTLVSPRATWFLSGSTAAPSFGGADAESITEYQNESTKFLRRITPRPIDAVDWAETVTDTDPSVYRTLVLENYNLTTSATQALHFTVVPSKIDGTAVGVDAKAKINAIPRLSDVIVHIGDPNLSLVDVTATVVAKPEYVGDHASVAAAAEAAIRAWMDPSVWGSDSTGDEATWDPENKVRVKQAEAILTNALPVAYVSPTVSVTLQVHGVGSPQTTDLTLPGIAPLAKANTVTITVVDPS